jgi:hypothetical protein
MCKYFLIVLLYACSTNEVPPAPEVIINFPDSSVSDVDISYVQGSAVGTWGKLGFKEVKASDLPECNRYWYGGGSSNCVINIWIVADVYLEPDGHRVAGHADKDSRTIGIDKDLHGYNFWRTSIHELGHILLDCGHLPDDIDGIMNPWFSGDSPTKADYALACSSIGICI